MWNKARTTQSNPSLDQIEVGCLIDGSHQHIDDFSVAVIRYAEALGYTVQDIDLVHVLIRTQGLQPMMSETYLQNFGHYLSIAADEAVDWMNEHIVTGDHLFHVRESDLFLSPADEIED